MRRLLVLIGAVTLVAGAAWAVKADTERGLRTPLTCMDSVWGTTEASTSSTQFETVPGFTDDPSSVFPIAIDVSALVSGAPVEFRVLSTNAGSQTHASKPGATRFVPPGGSSDSFAYQWIEPNQSAAVHVNSLRLQWRSPSGDAVHLLRGDMSVQYDTEQGACTGSS
ncbi:MAG: hypothetical protein ACJ77A_10425 [Actinomycetota bacterium]